MLYTEMVATQSAIHGDRKKILSYSPQEKPLALQVGGSDKDELAEVAKIAEDMGYDEININLPIEKIKKCKKIGLTSGASAPEKLVQDFISNIKKHVNVTIEEFVSTKENVTFKLPSGLN